MFHIHVYVFHQEPSVSTIKVLFSSPFLRRHTFLMFPELIIKLFAVFHFSLQIYLHHRITHSKFRQFNVD